MVDSYDDWSRERGPRRPEPRLEQRLDQWVTAGRQLVDGVSGARPGGRSGTRSPRMRLDHLGRWVEDKLDWLLEDDDGWRESWEQPEQAAQRSSRRQPLEAISRRRLPVASRAEAPVDDQAWPDDDSFSLNRWQRGASREAASPPPAAPSSRPQSGRALPRSSRRRLD